ncbi:hypothetical protein BGZ65_004137, partial [Modicella reniformis]
RGSKTRSVLLYCARSIHLLAAAYAYSQHEAKRTPRDPSQETITFEEHAEAIGRFTLGNINRLLSKKDYNALNLIYKRRKTGETKLTWNSNNSWILRPMARAKTLKDLAFDEGPNQSKMVVSVLTLLLDRNEFRDTNRIFIEGLLKLGSGTWIPSTEKSLNPIAGAIENKDEKLLKILIDYCVKDYPDIIADVFISTSYIPARNHEYVTSHAISTSNRIQDFVDGNKNPAFTLRSQLPTTTQSSSFFMSANGDFHRLHHGSEFRFPLKRNVQPTASKKRSNNIYVSPFQFRPIEPLDDDPQTTQTKTLKRQHKESVFDHIAGKNHFDNPAIVAIIRFKWYTFVIKYWLVRFFVVLTFFILMMFITAKQITVSSVKKGQILTEDEIAARYLPNWRPIIMVSIPFGLLLFAYELWQMTYSPKQYFKSQFNYVSLAAFLSPVVGCFLFLRAEPGVRSDTGMDGGPSQIWILAFSILFQYTNLVLELRVIRQLGITVNIISNITQKVSWFMLIFALFLVGFTHAFLYVLHTRSYKECLDDSCIDLDYPPDYPTGFFAALSATYFFLAGRYNPIDESFDKGTTGFNVMMVIFYFFSAILLLNVLIALMNDAFNESEKEGELAHWKLLSGVIAEVETHAMFKSDRERGDYYPKQIYYGESEEEVREFHKKYSNADVETSGVAASSIGETQRSINDIIMDLGKDMAEQSRRQYEELAGRSNIQHDELTTLRALVESSRDNDEVKKELTDLKEVLMNIASQLKINVPS